MKLTTIEINDFKSIRRSNKFEIGDVTCLVGKNEAGKTALLEAIYRLFPIVPEHGTFDVTDDYPRADVEDYRQAVEKEEERPAIVTKATYTLDADDVRAVEVELGKGVLTSPTFTLSKGYANGLRVGLPVDEAIAAKALIEKSDLSDELKREALASKSLIDVVAFAESHAQQCAAAVNKARKHAEAITDETEKQKAMDEANELAAPPALGTLKANCEAIQKKQLWIYIWEKHLKPRVPKFLYFDEYYQMSGQLNIEELKKRLAGNTLDDSDRPMLGLIELARLDIDELVAPDRTETLVAKLEGASNHLSKQILKYWSQNQHIQVRFDVRPARSGDPVGMQTGTNLWGRVHDSVHLVSTPLGSRSRGFVWFFSFLAWFSQQQKKGEPIILLLDEPGLFLHAKAQGDLLRYIEEELKPQHQVIFTTHSPFMIDATKFDRVRIVEDRSMLSKEELPLEERGTKVFSEVLEAEQGSLFPLQGALGYDLSQSLFVGPCSLIVEGVSDLLYLQTMSSVLDEAGQEGLSSKWTITPVGGSDKVPTFVALLGAQSGMKIATLIDIQASDRQRIEQLYKRKLLKQKNVITFADFTGTAEADIEDLFDLAFYLGLVNAEYKKELTKPIAESDLPKGGPRILVRLEEYFKKNPLKKGSFNHYRPARYLTENIGSLKASLSKDTLDRFEKAMKAANAII